MCVVDLLMAPVTPCSPGSVPPWELGEEQCSGRFQLCRGCRGKDRDELGDLCGPFQPKPFHNPQFPRLRWTVCARSVLCHIGFLRL